MSEPVALSPALSGYFDESYSEWKGWNEADFGVLGFKERAAYARELRPIVKARSTPIRRVLEIGVGQGGFQRYCEEQGWETSGTEMADVLVRAGKAAGFSICHADDLNRLPNVHFDLIAGFDVIEHVPQAEILKLLATLRSKLAPGGTILLRFPNADCWLGMRNFNGDVTHVTAMGCEKLNYFAERSGLTLTDFRPEARLGFDGGWAKGFHAFIAGPTTWLIASIIRHLYFPRIRIVLSTSNVVAHLCAK